MSAERSGGGDSKRTLELLWGLHETTGRGRRPKLNIGAVAAAAVELADLEGLDGLSMRRIAERLGVGAMSLYTYFPSKAELLDVMLDHASGEIADAPAPEGGLRARLERIARENWDLHLRHPWILGVVTHRPSLGPNTMRKYERELQALDGVGLDDLEMDHTLELLLAYVRGAARAAVGAREVERATGQSDAEWWADRAPLLEKVMDPARFPTAGRVGSAVGQAYDAVSSPWASFDYGLARVLDGVEALVAARGA